MLTCAKVVTIAGLTKPQGCFSILTVSLAFLAPEGIKKMFPLPAVQDEQRALLLSVASTGSFQLGCSPPPGIAGIPGFTDCRGQELTLEPLILSPDLTWPNPGPQASEIARSSPAGVMYRLRACRIGCGGSPRQVSL